MEPVTDEKRPESREEHASLSPAAPEEAPTRVHSLEDLEALLREELENIEPSPPAAAAAAPPAELNVELDLDDLLAGLEVETRTAEVDPLTGEPVADEPSSDEPDEETAASDRSADEDLDDAFFQGRPLRASHPSSFAKLEAELAASGIAPQSPQPPNPLFDPFAEPTSSEPLDDEPDLSIDIQPPKTAHPDDEPDLSFDLQPPAADPPDDDEPDISFDLQQPEAADDDEPPDAGAAEAKEDRGALAALRTLRRRRRREERFELIGQDTEALEARRALLQELAARGEGPTRADALVAAAEIAEALGLPEEALADYLDALEADGTHPIALRAARRLQWAREDWTSVATLLEREAAAVEDPEEHMALAALRAELCASALGDASQAEALLHDAPTRVDGQPAAALPVLRLLRARFALREGKIPAAAEALGGVAEAWSDAMARSALALHVAALWEASGEDERALKALERLPAEELPPWGLALRLRLQTRATASNNEPDSVRETLEELVRRLGRGAGPLYVAWAQRALARGEVLDTLPEEGRSPWLLRAQALALWSRIGETTASLAAEAAQRWEGTAPSGAERAAARCLLALLWARDGHLERAEQSLLEAERSAEAPELVRWVRERLRITGPQDLNDPYEAAANHLLNEEAEPEQAALAQAAEGARPEAADVLLIDAASPAREQADVALRRMIARRSGADRLAAWIARFALRGGGLCWEDAQALIRTLAQEAPGASWATRIAVAALERAEGAPEAARSTMLQERWLDEALSGSGCMAASAGLQAARIAAAAGEEERALEALRRALEAAPDHPPVHWRLQHLARRLGLDDVLLESLQLAAEAADSNQEAARLRARTAWLRMQDDPMGSLEELDLLLEHHPEDEVAQEIAIELRRTLPEEHADLPARLLARAERGEGAAALVDAVEAALRAMALDQDEVAAEAWRIALRITADACFRDALRFVELRAGHHAEEAQRALDAVREAKEAVRGEALEALVAFDLYARNDRSSAVLTAQQLLEERPDHLVALRLLECHFMEGRRLEELAQLQTLFAEGLDAPQIRAAHRRMAVRLLRAARDPEADERADEILLSWAREEGLDPWLALRAEGAALHASDDEALAGARAARLRDLDADPLARASVAIRLAEALERANGPEAALAPLNEAAAEAPRHGPAQEHLARLAARLERYEMAAEAFERAARASAVPRRAAALAYRAARLWQERLDRPERALDAFRFAAERDVAYLDVFDRLRRLLQERGEHEELLALIGRRIEVGAPSGLLASLYVQRAEAARALGRSDEEGEALRSALALEPERREALDRLAEVAFSQGSWREAAEVLVRAARLTRDRERLRDLFMRLGRIYAEHLPDPRRAEAAYRRALKLSPDDLDAMRGLAEVLRAQGRHAEAVETLRRLASIEADPDTQREVRLNLAEVLEEQGALREAEAELEQARRQSPIDMTLLQALTRFYERHGAGPALSVHLGRALSDFRHAVEADPSDLAAWHGLCEVLRWRRQPDAARSCARIALALGLRHDRLPELAGQGPLPGIGPSLRAEEVDEAIALPPLSLGAREAFRLASEGLDKAIPFDPREAGASVPSRSETLTRDGAAVARWLGLPALRLYVSDTQPWLAVPTSGSPPTVLIGRSWLDRPEPERRFVLARAAKLAADGMGILVRLAPEDALRVMAALVLHYHPEAVPEPLRTDAQAELGRRIAKGTKRRARSELDALMVELAGAVFAPRAALPRAAACFGSRAALLAGGEPDAALEALCRLHHGEAFPSPRAPGSRIALVRKHPECWDLLRFAIEDVHLSLRKRFAESGR